MAHLTQQIQSDMKTSMKAKDRRRLGAIRLIWAAIKQVEIDQRKQLEDGDIIGILSKLTKQCQESLTQYLKANRKDLASQEEFEISIIKQYLPQPLSEQEINQMIQQAIKEIDAKDISEMGKVMKYLQSKVQGRADLSLVSRKVRALLTSSLSSD